jgi:hypothetical protein
MAVHDGTYPIRRVATRPAAMRQTSQVDRTPGPRIVATNDLWRIGSWLRVLSSVSGPIDGVLRPYEGGDPDLQKAGQPQTARIGSTYLGFAMAAALPICSACSASGRDGR